MITRRGIVTGSLTAAAMSQANGANGAVTVGVLGTGNRGTFIAAMLNKNTPGRVVALCDVVPEHMEKAKTAIGVGYGGGQLSERVVRWELKGNRVLLQEVNFSVAADPKSPIAAAVKAANNDAIIMSFPVAAFAKDGAPVIEVTRLFTSDIQEFSARQHLGATAVDATRSFIEHISPFAENVEAEVTMTYTSNGGRGGVVGGGRGGGGLGGGTMRGGL